MENLMLVLSFPLSPSYPICVSFSWSLNPTGKSDRVAPSTRFLRLGGTWTQYPTLRSLKSPNFPATGNHLHTTSYNPVCSSTFDLLDGTWHLHGIQPGHTTLIARKQSIWFGKTMRFYMLPILSLYKHHQEKVNPMEIPWKSHPWKSPAFLVLRFPLQAADHQWHVGLRRRRGLVQDAHGQAVGEVLVEVLLKLSNLAVSGRKWLKPMRKCWDFPWDFFFRMFNGIFVGFDDI